MRITFPKRVRTGALLAVFAVQIVLILLTLPGQSIHVDEALLGEQVYWEVKDGIPRQDLLAGMFTGEEGKPVPQLVRHKLFNFLGCVVTRVAGFHLPALRLITLLSGFLLLGLMWAYLRKRGEDGGAAFLPVAVIFLFCPLVFRYIKVFRPEFLLAALGFLSFLLVLRALERERSFDALAAGLAAGLAVLAHLNGVMFIAAGLGTLLFYRKWKPAALFAVVSIATGALYLYDVVGNFSLFREQLFNDFTVNGSEYTVPALLAKIFKEHARYFRTPEIIGISALFVLSLPAALREKRGRRDVIFLYLAILVPVLAMAAKGFTPKYAIPVLPFFVLIIGKALRGIVHEASGNWKYYRWAFIAVLTAYLGYGIYAVQKNVRESGDSLAENNAVVARAMEKGSRVLAPSRFIFNEIGNFTVRDLFAARYRITKGEGKPFNLTTLCDYALENRFEYILLDREYRNSGHIDPQKVYSPIWGYAVIKVYSNDAILMKRTAVQFGPRP